MEENIYKTRRYEHRRSPSRRPARLANKLWKERKKSRLGHKQVAHLMGLKTVANLSRYERGDRLPGLANALKLEFILGVPIRFLFHELWSQVRDEIIERRERLERTLP